MTRPPGGGKEASPQQPDSSLSKRFRSCRSRGSSFDVVVERGIRPVETPGAALGPTEEIEHDERKDQEHRVLGYDHFRSGELRDRRRPPPHADGAGRVDAEPPRLSGVLRADPGPLEGAGGDRYSHAALPASE